MGNVGDGIVEEKRESSVLAHEYIHEGMKAFGENRYSDAILLYGNALELYQQLEDWENCIRCHNMLGVIYSLVGDESMSVDHFLVGLECAHTQGIEHMLALIYNNIGYRYRVLEKYDKALDFYRKAEAELSKTRILSETRYPVWCVVTYLNMMSCFLGMEDYEGAREYLKKAETFIYCSESKEYLNNFHIMENCLQWATGEKSTVRQNLPGLVESVGDFYHMEDYVENVKQLVLLLKQMKAQEEWQQVLLYFERYVEKQGTVYFRMVLTEMWMDFYLENGDEANYTVKCVEHAELYRQQKKINDQERADAIDMKISLQQKEAERKRAEAQLNTDILTGIGNRYCLRKEFRQFLKEAVIKLSRVAVGVLDIDHFKQQNDLMGHIHGDACLCEVASVVNGCLDHDGKVYRFGGDEFVVLLKDGDKKKLQQLARRIREQLRVNEENREQKAEIPLTVSQGYISMIPKENETLLKLMKRADEAMYYVKERGRDGFEILLE